MNKTITAPLTLALLVSACAVQSQLRGTDLGKQPAPDFHLVDQNGHTVSLTGLRGKVVVLTFLYTHCTDECPLIASELYTTSRQLGKLMDRVAFVAVSVDPANDTPDAIRTFIHVHQLDGQMLFLTGSLEQLQPVWAAYYIAAQPSADSPSSGSITHSTRVVVIDKEGNERINFDSEFNPADLAFDLRALVNEP